MKTAIVLFNLGGPDSLAAVRPFLYNLFSDPAILRMPAPLRQVLAFLLALRRAKTARAIYARLGGYSPLLANTSAQAQALEAALATREGIGTVKTFIAMRYWHPFTEETARAVADFAPDRIVRLPLYPQYSTTTTASSLKAWDDATAKFPALETVPVETIGCWPDDPGFIEAQAELVRDAFRRVDESLKASGGAAPLKPRLLLSAHGLPEKIVAAGDPYPLHCEKTAAALRQALGLPEDEARLCYQSRVGPLKWIGPSTEEEIEKAAHDRRPLVVAPVAFVSDHSETLVEIGMEYREKALKAGCPAFVAVPAVGTSARFIGGLADRIFKALGDSVGLSGDGCAAPGEVCCRKRGGGVS